MVGGGSYEMILPHLLRLGPVDNPVGWETSPSPPGKKVETTLRIKWIGTKLVDNTIPLRRNTDRWVNVTWTRKHTD